jgi:hypothetical protein
MGHHCLMKKQLLLLTCFCGLFMFGFSSCNKCTDTETSLYSFKLTQPDGTIPKSGYAIIYEKHLDPTTGFGTLRLPVSDTLTWEGDEIIWADIRESHNRPLVIGCFSPEVFTDDALRHEWHPFDSGTPEIELSFLQSREVKVRIRSFHENQPPSQLWGLIISPNKTDMTSFYDSNISRSQLDAMAFAQGNISSLETSTEFNENSTLYAHLFRLNENDWLPTGKFELAIEEGVTGFEFNTNHTMSCCE